ncbi:hypothetical protein [Asticcacaulis sp.]|uniref:hypothetical protein n=1 Tax=Asticcacaulis sp. TaxID=1872648 RepID=UPI002BB0F4A4|nr:hypothetical protein [Asticcacaulis sp.]HTM81580.1 hypothetical protein [Asticcacaulis sp.]
MPVTKHTVDQFVEVLAAFHSALDDYDVPKGKSGIACVKGTLTSQLSVLRLMAEGLESRDVTDKDQAELTRTVSILTWLSTDDYVTRDFKGVELTLIQTAFANDYDDIGIVGQTGYDAAMRMLSRALKETVLT